MAPKETTEFDFAPFNPDQVLRALCSVLRTSKRISWNYAGDLQSVIDRIGRVFEASRALLFVSAGGREVAEIFEFDEPGLAPVAHHFSSPYSQRLAQYLISLPDELSLIEVPQKFAGELDESYREIFLRVFDHFGSQHCHLVPLKMYSEAGGERRAGLLLVQPIIEQLHCRGPTGKLSTIKLIQTSHSQKSRHECARWPHPEA